MNFDKLLVATKFAPPRVGARHISRKNLLAQLRDAQHCAIALVTGSAGFGKTTLLVQWRQELMKTGTEVAWLSLSHDDKQLPSFCAYLFAAFRRLGIQVEDDMLLDGGTGKLIETVVAVVASEAERIGNALYLILDNYQHVEDPWAHKLMQQLLNHCPSNLHIIISSRAAPPLNLSRLRVLAQVAEIGSSELPFDLEETRIFFEQNLGTINLNVDELRLIHDMTNGWPASLQLIAITLKSRPQKRAKLRSFLLKSTDLQAYLAEDVVAHLAPELTEFMETMAVCRRFNAELAAFVAENPHAPDLIKRAEDENLLIYRVESDDQSPWYRFHPLFGEFLAARLARRGKPAVESLHRRASQWFAENDFLVESVRHANLGGDRDFALRTIEEAAPATWSFAYITPMLHLLERLHQETLFAHPRLFFLGCLVYAFTGRPGKAEQWIEQIRKSDAAKIPAISSKLAFADAAIAMQRDDIRRVIDLLEPTYKALHENRFLQYVYLSTLASAYGAVGRYADARKLLDSNPVALEDRATDMGLVVEGTRVQVLLTEGNVNEAARIGSSILARSEEACGRGSVSANLCAASLCNAYYELDRIDEAREVLANRTGILRSSAPIVMVLASLCHARLDLLQKTPDAALELLESQATHFHLLELDRPLAYMLLEQVKILVARGDHIRAAELVTRLNQLAAPDREAEGYRSEIQVVAAIARARLALINWNPEEALEALAPARRFTEQFGRTRMMVATNLLAASAHARLKQEDDAAKCLVQALQLGARHGLIRSFLDEGNHVEEMLAALQGDESLDVSTSRHLDELVERFARIAQARTALSAQATPESPRDIAAGKQVSMTPRELEILSLISQAMSGKRIALTLNITPETVKWNVRNILAKLGVSSRYDAMTWARQQGLIE